MVGLAQWRLCVDVTGLGIILFRHRQRVVRCLVVAVVALLGAAACGPDDGVGTPERPVGPTTSESPEVACAALLGQVNLESSDLFLSLETGGHVTCTALLEVDGTTYSHLGLERRCPAGSDLLVPFIADRDGEVVLDEVAFEALRNDPCLAR
jgi:hypothetical protein